MRNILDDVNGGYLLEDLVLVVRRGEIGWVHSEGVYEIVPKQECKDVGMRLLDLIWVDTDKSVDPAHKKIRSRLCAREYKTKKQGKIQRALPTSQLFSGGHRQVCGSSAQENSIEIVCKRIQDEEAR